MDIRKTRLEEVDQVIEILNESKKIMREDGNFSQWNGNYPTKEMILSDIEQGNSYVLEENGKLCGTFAFIIGNDPTYDYIENGSWLNEEEYGTIHRIGSNRLYKGVFQTALSFCEKRMNNIRIDTHKDNHIMQMLMEKYGFISCGIIYIADGSPRLAYQKKIL